MSMRREGWLAAIGLGVALVAGIPVDEATASSRPHLSARINGRALTASGKRLQVVNLSTIFEIVASTKNVHFNRSMAFACVIFDLATTPLPVTLTQCNGNYQETRISRHPSAKVWTTAAGIQLTIDSFDGTRARGTFSGAFEVSGDGSPPAAIQNGKFDAVVTSPGG